MRFIKRTLENVLKSSPADKYILVTGMGECGKSTCTLSVYEKYGIISLHNIKALTLLSNNPKDFFIKYPAPLIIDNMEEGLSILDHLEKGSPLIFISDSDAASIKSILLDNLTVYNLHGFSIYELANMGHMQKPYIPSEKLPAIISKKSLNYTYQLIWRGFSPEAAIIDNNEQWDNVINGIVEKLIKNNIMGRINFGSKLIFLNFLKELILYMGRELNISELAEKLNMAPNTIKSWISILENINFIYLLQPYSMDNNRRYIKTPKLYVEDTGIAAWLLSLDTPEKLEQSDMNGKFFENFVVMEIVKSYHHNGKECRLYHYRDNLKVKIDLLIEDDDNLYPIIISNTQTPSKEMAEPFQKALMHKQKGYGNIICLIDKSKKLDNDVSAVSIWEI